MGKRNKKKGGSNSNKPKPTNTKDTGAFSDGLQSRWHDESARLSEANIEKEAILLEQRIMACLDPFQRISITKALIATTHTQNIDEQNRQDPFGDGDQRRLPNDQQAQIFRNLWGDGFDLGACFNLGLYPHFTQSCILGGVKSVTRLLLEAATSTSNPGGQLQRLLETRSTTFRASPLLLTIGMAKFPQMVLATTQRMGIPNMDQEGVASLLLKYGANPIVKDASGKTAVHWGAGGISNSVTRKIAGWCIVDGKSCHHFGQTITIQDTLDTKYNGKEGTLKGFDVVSGRRFVEARLDNDNNGGEIKELLLQPKHIFYQDQCTYRDDCNLVDVPDRLGAVALYEVVMRGGPVAAKFLSHEHNEHNANVDIKELSGITPRCMSPRPMGAWNRKP